MLFRGRRLIKTTFVSILQQLFKCHPKFRWNKNVLQTKIFIDEQYQRSDRKFPYIVVNDTTNSNFFKTSYDKNFQHEDYDEDGILIGTRYGGSMTPSFTLEFGSLNIYDLEIIIDIIETFFEFAGVEKLRDAGIVIQNISDSGINTETYGKDNVYILNMNFDVYTEWEKYITQDELDTINAVEVDPITLYIKDEAVYVDKMKELNNDNENDENDENKN